MITRQELDEAIKRLPDRKADGRYYQVPIRPSMDRYVSEYDPGRCYDMCHMRTIAFEIRTTMVEGVPMQGFFYHELLVKVLC